MGQIAIYFGVFMVGALFGSVALAFVVGAARVSGD